MSQDDVFTNDIWSLYFHDPYDEKWTYESYQRIVDISSVDAFWTIHNTLKDKVHNGMFFYMREHIFPCWDDDNNKNGGCLSIKVLKQDMKDYWEKLCISLLSENLVSQEMRARHWNNINGISTSPKKHFCIIKIWVKDEELNDKRFFNLPPNYYGDILYRSNIQSMENNNNVLLGS